MFDLTEYLLIIIIACVITIIIIGSSVIVYLFLLSIYYKRKGLIWSNWEEENFCPCPKCEFKVSWSVTLRGDSLLDIKCPKCGTFILRKVK